MRIIDESKILTRVAEMLRKVEGTALEKMVGSAGILSSEVFHPE